MKRLAVFSLVTVAALALVAPLSLLSANPSGSSEPGKGKDIVETAVAAGQFKTLAAALTAAELVDDLKGKGPFTVFAPTDEAFAQLPAGTVEDLLKPENRSKLVAVLKYHVVPGKVTSEQVIKLKEAKTLQGQSVKINAGGSRVTINDSQVVTADVTASNGVIHVIDRVLLPRE